MGAPIGQNTCKDTSQILIRGNVTRLGNYWKFQASNFLKKEVQNIWRLFELFKNHHYSLSKICCGHLIEEFGLFFIPTSGRTD